MKKVLTVLIILATLGMVVWGVTRTWREESEWRDLIHATSELPPTNRTITILGDEWLGYFAFRSFDFRRRMAEEGIRVKFRMEADFETRIQALRDGEAEFIVATLDSYLTNGGRFGWPGVVVFVIDESFGGDAVIAREGIASVDDLNGPEIRGAFVGESPSEFLITSQASHFELGQLMPRLKEMRVGSAEEAYEALESGKVDFAVLWEPLTSKALSELDGVRKLVDTREAQGIIIDIALASRRVVADDPQLVQTVTRAYFQTLHDYLNDVGKMQKVAARDADKSQEEAARMLVGIKLSTLDENRTRWLFEQELLADRAGSISRILADAGIRVTLPADDPRSLIHTSALGAVANNPGDIPAVAARYHPTGNDFAKLSDEEWAGLARQVRGTLLDEPITFRPGSTEIPEDFKYLLRDALPKLNHYPTHRLIVEAHVAPGDDPEGAVALSENRAEAVKEFLVLEGGVPRERIHTIGAGDTKPPDRLEDEGYPAWQRRARRARITLVGEES